MTQPRKSKPTKVADILTGVLKSAGLADRVGQAAVVAAWADLVGERIAGAAVPEAVAADGTLFVRVKSSAWRQELSLDDARGALAAQRRPLGRTDQAHSLAAWGREPGAGVPLRRPREKQAVSPPLTAGRALTARQAASRIVARQVRELLSHEKAARRGEDAEAVHQMRVEARRLRAALALFSTVVRPPRRAGRSRLRWLSRTLGRVRDLDVMTALLEDRHLAHLDGGEAARLEDLLAALKERRWRAQKKLAASLARGRYAKLKDALRGFARHPRFVGRGDGEAMAARYLTDVIHRQARRASAHRGMVERTPEAADLHALRMAVKRLRYVLDFHAEVCGIAFDEERRLTRLLQDCLGEIHDHDLLLEWFRGRHGAAAPVEAALFAGAWRVLPERLGADRARLLRRFLRLRRQWLARTEPGGPVVALEAPRFVNLEAAPVQLRLASPLRTVASLRIVR